MYYLNIYLRTFVYYHADSVGYKHDSSLMEISLIKRLDGYVNTYYSNFCEEHSFELMIDWLEFSDDQEGYYSGKFEGLLCDSAQVNSISIKSGKIIRARL